MKILVCHYYYYLSLLILIKSLSALASSLYALIVCLMPPGQTTVTVTMFTSASEASTGGYTLSTLQFADSNLCSSMIGLIA